MGPIVGLGEVLWDLLPAGRRAGGAPFNFAFHCSQLGHPAVIVSRCGDDEPGEALRREVRQLGLADDFIQHDAEHPTGTVAVTVEADGQPSYEITQGVAWDFLEWTPALAELACTARAVCFGTLAQRSRRSFATVQRFLDEAHDAVIVCDINIRQHYFNEEIVELSLHLSDWLKLNEHELPILRGLLGLAGGNDAESLAELRRRYKLKLVCLTRGADGCLVQTAAETVELPGVPVRVADTVGAGDAFTAGVLCRTLEGHPLAESASFANRLAAEVARHPGGTPCLGRETLEAAPPP
jgi:fructokinase